MGHFHLAAYCVSPWKTWNHHTINSEKNNRSTLHTNSALHTKPFSMDANGNQTIKCPDNLCLPWAAPLPLSASCQETK